MQYATWSLVIDSLLAESGEFRDVYVFFEETRSPLMSPSS